MGLNQSKAKVIDKTGEYRNGVTKSLDENSTTAKPSSSLSSSLSSSQKSPVVKNGAKEVVKAISTAKNVFSWVGDVMKTCGEETNVTILKCLKMLRTATFFCEGAGVILNLVVDDAVVAEMKKICEEIREVRNDIKELERTMKWETTRMQYADICTMIVTGMEFCKQIQSNPGNDSLKHDYEERLKELCSNQRLTLAMNTLLDGITGKGDFRIDILQHIYDQTNGSRPDVMRMAGRLLQLLTGGLTSLLTYETLVRGQQSAEQLEQAMYADRVKEAEQCYMNVVQRCVNESKENMAKDIDKICEGKKNLTGIPKQICSKLARKYDWLKFQCMACKYGEYVHCHGSRIVKRLTRVDPKYIICFYTSKCVPLNTFSSLEKNQIRRIISEKDGMVTRLTAGIVKPRFYDPVMEYMNEISDKRQCWVIGVCAELPDLNAYYNTSEGTHANLFNNYGDEENFFVSMFFQD